MGRGVSFDHITHKNVRNWKMSVSQSYWFIGS